MDWKKTYEEEQQKAKRSRRSAASRPISLQPTQNKNPSDGSPAGQENSAGPMASQQLGEGGSFDANGQRMFVPPQQIQVNGAGIHVEQEDDLPVFDNEDMLYGTAGWQAVTTGENGQVTTRVTTDLGKNLTLL